LLSIKAHKVEAVQHPRALDPVRHRRTYSHPFPEELDRRQPAEGTNAGQCNDMLPEQDLSGPRAGTSSQQGGSSYDGSMHGLEESSTGVVQAHCLAKEANQGLQPERHTHTSSAVAPCILGGTERNLRPRLAARRCARPGPPTSRLRADHFGEKVGVVRCSNHHPSPELTSPVSPQGFPAVFRIWKPCRWKSSIRSGVAIAQPKQLVTSGGPLSGSMTPVRLRGYVIFISRSTRATESS
jgi:hypothetical protein